MDIKPQCQRCGESFEPRTSGGKPQKFCSRTCYDRWHTVRHREANRPVRSALCTECGGPIAHNLETGRPRRYCSERCKQRVSNRAQNRRRLPAPKQVARACERCGATFGPLRRDQVYCSPRCRINAGQARRYHGAPLRQGVQFDRQCVECGSAFVALKDNAKWCSAICRIRTRGRDESRRRTPGSGASLYADREIFERDKWRCHLCGKKVDPKADRRSPLGATIDHLVPLSEGGRDDAANVATAHLKCNRDKGVRAMNEQLRLI